MPLDLSSRRENVFLIYFIGDPRCKPGTDTHGDLFYDGSQLLEHHQPVLIEDIFDPQNVLTVCHQNPQGDAYHKVPDGNVLDFAFSTKYPMAFKPLQDPPPSPHEPKQ